MSDSQQKSDWLGKTVEKQDYVELEKERNIIKELNRDIQKSVKDKDEQLNRKSSDLKSTKAENETLYHKLVEVSNELENLKSKHQTDIQFQMKCSRCDMIVKSYDQMKLHNRTYHSQNKSSQYEKVAFEEYSCFYCETTITSEHNLFEGS